MNEMTGHERFTTRHLKFVLGFLAAAVLLAQVQQPALSPTICQGRLTLTTATPVTTADVTAATTLFFTPYTGNRCPVFDSTGGEIDRTFAELSIAVPATTSTMYDVWLFDNSGVLALEVLAWTNDTTRATGLALQSGVNVKSGTITRRYLGSFRTTTVSGQTEDSLLKRYVWNFYNRVPRALQRFDNTNSWTYTTSTWRQANGSAANQVDVVVGVAETRVWLSVGAVVQNDTGGVAVGSAIGLDSTTTPASNHRPAIVQIKAGSEIVSISGIYDGVPGVGRHFFAMLERSQATGVTTWWSNSGLFAFGEQTGVLGWIEG